MIKGIHSRLQFTSFRSRHDRALGFSGETPELTSEQKVVFMDLQGVECDVVLTPVDAPEAEVEEIDTDLHRYSQSQRLRNVLYRIWERDHLGLSWDDFYHQYTDKIIDWLKEKL